MKKSPEEIIKILHSIKSLELDKYGVLEVKFNGADEVMTVSEFESGTFTHDLLEMIEDHITAHEFESD